MASFFLFEVSVDEKMQMCLFLARERIFHRELAIKALPKVRLKLFLLFFFSFGTCETHSTLMVGIQEVSPDSGLSLKHHYIRSVWRLW